MATNYQRGRAFEYRTRKRLGEMGAAYIMRAASSKGAADLIALFPRDDSLWQGVGPKPIPVNVWLVQCKMTGRLPKSEREELMRLAAETGARAVLASKNKRGTLVFHEITRSGDLTTIIQVVS